MYVLVYGSIDGFITGPEVAYNKVEELISAVLTVCLFLLLQINYQRNICLPLGVPSVIYHRVTSRTIVSSNRNPVFICFVRYLKCCILCVCYVAIKVLQVNSKHDVIRGCQAMKIVVSKPELTA